MSPPPSPAKVKVVDLYADRKKSTPTPSPVFSAACACSVVQLCLLYLFCRLADLEWPEPYELSFLPERSFISLARPSSAGFRPALRAVDHRRLRPLLYRIRRSGMVRLYLPQSVFTWVFMWAKGHRGDRSQRMKLDKTPMSAQFLRKLSKATYGSASPV
jgi:hypothetical protein